jgi:acetylornithine deacetylase/succinyl-diaminopimelate desuccinylase-like protein
MKEILLALDEPTGTVEIEFLTGTNGFSAPKDGEGVKAFASAIQAVTGKPARFLNATGVSDGRYFADDGIEILNLGPGSGAEGHAANESVPIAEMVDSARIQLIAVEQLLGLKRA